MSDLHEKLELVVDKRSFMIFVRALIKDRKVEIEIESKLPKSEYGYTGAMGWEN